ncbi:MurR/RpiR family transcriptional regulator [Thomasclavelia spiroformis]|uniref:MurR/RpiR family transcriptional regulator n=1 Tax=Thomasclavelia spiroformis TaxID=29348 RepID=UPI0024B1C1A0|nr:MurR/RpiR family transcriptional regulator [Thomasclavelia spiroformis]
MNIELKSKIKNNLYGMSATEKKIADYILNHEFSLENISIKELAANINVSISAISRFTKKIGYKNFQDLRVHMISPTSIDSDSYFFPVDYETDSLLAISKSIFKSGISSLTETLTVLNEESLNKAIDILAKSRFCGMFGLGGSYSIIQNALQRFIRTSLECRVYNDFHTQLLSCSRFTNEDCAFIVSHSGRNIDIMRIVDILKKHNVPIITITSDITSPLAKQSDVVFSSISEEIKYRPEALSSTISQLMIVDTLFTLYSLKVDHEKNHFKEVRSIINSTRR